MDNPKFEDGSPIFPHREDARACGQHELPGSTLDEFELMDRLATMLGIAGPESQEERNNSPVYQRRVLRSAIIALEQGWKKKA